MLGAAFYGTAVRLGARARVKLAHAWTASASSDLVLGPGHNTLDRRGALRRLPAWRVGLRYQSTTRTVLEGYLTNMSGVTPATRHLTLPSTPTTLYGVGIAYTPSVSEPRVRAAQRAREMSRAWGGVTIPSPITMPAGTGLVEGSLDTEGALGFELTRALGRRIQVGLVSTRIRGPDAEAIMDAPIGSGFQYRFATKLTLVDRAVGAPLSVAGRVSLGRDFDDQQGYLVAELIADHGIADGVRLRVNPMIIQSGGRSPVTVAAGAVIRVGRLDVLPEWRVSLSGDPPVGALGLKLPVIGHLAGQLFVTNAGSTVGLGRMLADPGGYRAGLKVRLTF